MDKYLESALDMGDDQVLVRCSFTADRCNGDHRVAILGVETADGTLTLLGAYSLSPRQQNLVDFDICDQINGLLEYEEGREPDWDAVRDERDGF